MIALQLLAVMLIGVTIQHVTADHHEICAGCPIEISPDREDVRKGLNAALAGMNSNDVVVKVTKATVQVVNGARYVVEFEAETPGTNIRKLCHIDYVNRPWDNPPMAVSAFECETAQ